MAALATGACEATGSVVTFAAASGGGDSAVAGDDVVLLVRNADASDKTVTMVTPKNVEGQAIADRAIVVAAGTTKAIRLKRSIYADTDGDASWTYSATTSVTVAVFRV